MKKITLFILVTIFITQVQAQLSGTYSIDPTQPTGGTNYASFTDAITDLNTQGISAAVNFLVATNEVFSETPPAIETTGTAANPITFIRYGTGANPVIIPTGSGSGNQAAIHLKGSDYITFDGIDIDASTELTHEYGYYLHSQTGDGCKFNTIKNCVIKLNTLNTYTRGVYSYSSSSSVSETNSNNLFSNIEVYHSTYGFVITNVSGTGGIYEQGNTIENCKIGKSSSINFLTAGIYFTNQQNLTIASVEIDSISGPSGVYGIFSNMGDDQTFEVINSTISYLNVKDSASVSSCYGISISKGLTGTISGNTITNIDAVTNNSTAGIYLTSITGKFEISSNTISAITTADTGSSRRATGIYFSGSDTVYIANNMVSGICAPKNQAINSSAGIMTGGSAKIFLWYNTIYIDCTPLISDHYSTGTYMSTSDTIDVRNNIFINNSDVSTNGIYAIAFQKTLTTIMSQESNNNIYYAGNPGSKNILFRSGGTNYQTLATYQTAVSPIDSNSYTEDVQFFSNIYPYNLHVDPAYCTEAEGNATPISYVTHDIDNEPRHPGRPDIGADEFAGIVVFADAGPDFNICGFNHPLNGNDPTGLGGTGEWTLISGTGTIANPNSHNTTVSGLSIGANVFRWTVTVSGCEAWDERTITNWATTLADAGPDQDVCDAYVIIQGSEPTTGETGEWTVVNGTATINNPYDFATDAINLSSGLNTFRWTISNSYCQHNDLIDIFYHPVTNITQQPNSANLNPGDNATFIIAAEGSALAYQWRKDNTPLTDGGNITGSNTNTLMINNIQTTDMGAYDCIVSGICGNDTSDLAILSVITYINELYKGNVQVYPNPASENIQISSVKTIENIEICDATGRVIHFEEINKTNIVLSVSHLSSGIYFLNIRFRESIETNRIKILIQ